MVLLLNMQKCLFAVTTIEFVDTSARFYLLLLSGIEGMALRANVEFKNVALLGASGNEGCATSTYCRYFVIIGMYIFFHNYSPKITCIDYYIVFAVFCQSF